MTPNGGPTPGRRRGLRPVSSSPASGYLFAAALALPVLCGSPSPAQDLGIEEIPLPPLRIKGQSARAHTQGLELAAGCYYVTARREDVSPKRALLLRTDAAGSDWDAWDITPDPRSGADLPLDHPGGMQSDGRRLWIPLAQSKRHGRSIVRAFPLSGMIAGKPLAPEFEFRVNDHIGAVAVSTGRGLLFGANWDTEKIYVWDLKGALRQTLDADALKARGLGAVAGSESRAGVAVQDWKVIGDHLFASGLRRSPRSAVATSASCLCWFEGFLAPDFRRWTVPLPRRGATELAREAMAISGGFVYFLPEDLAASNRLFRASLGEIKNQVSAGQPLSPGAL